MSRQQKPGHNKMQVVRFRNLENYKEDAFCLEMSKTLIYDDVKERVANHLGLGDSNKIRITAQNTRTQQPRPQPDYFGGNRLFDMLGGRHKKSDILYYEVVDFCPSVSDRKFLNIAFQNAAKTEVSIHSVSLTCSSTVGDLLDQLKKKVELSHPNAELRLVQDSNSKISKIYPLSEKINNINIKYWMLRAEEIHEEKKSAGPRDRLIYVCQFKKDAAQEIEVWKFGDPFGFIIHETETLAEIKQRLQKKFHIPDCEFSKWKFAYMGDRAEYLQDSDILFNRFPEGRDDPGGKWKTYLRMEHSGSDAVNQQEGEIVVQPSEYVEGQQLLEAAQAGIVSAEESQPVKDPLSAKFTWKFKNFSRLNADKYYSDVFLVGQNKWQVMIFLNGSKLDHLSVYLKTIDSANLSYVEFSLAVVNQVSDKYTLRKDGVFKVTTKEDDCGFAKFMPLCILAHPGKGFIIDDTCIIEAEVSVGRPIKKQKVAVPMVLECSSDNSEESNAHSDKSTEAKSQNGATSGESTKAEAQAGTLIEVEVPNEEMNQNSALATVPELEMQTIQDNSALATVVPEVEMQTIQDGKVSENELPIEEMDLISASVPELEMQTELDEERSEPAVVVDQGSTIVQSMEQVPEPASTNEVMVPTRSTQSNGIAPPLEYPYAGQLFEEGQHRQEVLDEKFEDIGGFSILRTQALLYEKVWLKYGHIASSQVLTGLYSVQVTLVSDIMTCVMDMHQCPLAKVSSSMIETWGQKIMMAETLKFNVRWLREVFEEVVKNSSWVQELKTTTLPEKDQSIQEAQARVDTLEFELQTAREKLSTLQSEKQKLIEKGSRLLFDGLF